MNGAKAPETPSPTLQEKTVTPETLPTVIGADEGYDGLSQVTVNPDAQLKAENIRSGKTVFGVEGTFEGETQMVNGIDLMNAETGIKTIPSQYITGYNMALDVADIALSSCTYSETAGQTALPSASMETNYTANIYDGNTCYSFTNGPVNFSVGSYRPSGVYTYEDIHFDVPEQTITLKVMRGDQVDCANRRLKATYTMVPILGVKLSENGTTANNAIILTCEKSFKLPTIEVDQIIGESNAYGKPITITIPAFKLDCGGYYYSSNYKPYNNTVGLSLLMFPVKGVIS